MVSYLYDPDGFFQGNLETAGVKTLLSGPYRIDESEPFVSAAAQLASPLEQLALFIEEVSIDISYGEIDDNKEDIVALHPGSGSPSKNWSFESWVELAKRIYTDRPETTFLIISGEAETETIPAFLDLLQQAELPYRHLDQLPLPEVGKHLQVANFFLGHDSGISHLAASTGIDGLILFGPTIPEIWAPQSPGFDYIRAPGKQLGHLSVDEVWKHLPQRR